MNSQFSQKIFALLFIGAITLHGCKKTEKETITVENEKTDSIVKAEPFFKLSLAQWSLHRAIRETKTLNPFDFAQKAKEYGFEGVEYVSQLYRDQISEMGIEAVVDTLKSKSAEYGVENVLIMIDGEGDLASPDTKVRDAAVDNHKKWVDAAQALGCHSIRVNLSGSSDPEVWHNASVDGLGKLADYAAIKNINVIVENHGGLSSVPPKLIAVINEINQPNVGTLPDFGNFCIQYGDNGCAEQYPDIYEGIELLMTKAKGVSAKSYDFNDEGYETKLNYPRLLQIVKDSGYEGYIDVEYEGSRLSEEEGIFGTKALLLKAAESVK